MGAKILNRAQYVAKLLAMPNERQREYELSMRVPHWLKEDVRKELERQLEQRKPQKPARGARH